MMLPQRETGNVPLWGRYSSARLGHLRDCRTYLTVSLTEGTDGFL